MPIQFDQEAISFVGESLRTVSRHTHEMDEVDRLSRSTPVPTYSPSERIEVACSLVEVIRAARLDTQDDNVLAAVLLVALHRGETAATYRLNPHLFGR